MGCKEPQSHLLFINLELVYIYHLTFFFNAQNRSVAWTVTGN